METQTVTLTEFLLARIAEDEAVFSGWREEPWKPMYADSANGLDSTHDGPMIHPGRVLAECEAKRRILNAHPEAKIMGYGDEAGCCDGCDGAPDWPCATVAALASIYADHPDFREEWRP